VSNHEIRVESKLKILYFTHCCAKKDDSLRGTGKRVSPLELYLASPTQRFMRRCIEVGVEWAIFSDEHAFLFPEDRIEWYEKDPNTLSSVEKEGLFNKAYEVLKNYHLAYFYCNPGRLHPVYRELVNDMKKRGVNIREMTHLNDILPR
jgi:hypothetical protein